MVKKRSAWMLAALVFALFPAAGAVAGAAQRDGAARGKHIVFVIGEREYNTDRTLPRFARRYLEPAGFRTSFVYADKQDPNHFPGLEVLREADLLVLSVRRRTLSQGQMQLIRAHLEAGKPMIGIRTASHAFSLRLGQPPEGHVQWPDFDRQVLGARYAGHFRNREGTDVTTRPQAETHEILTGIQGKSFRSGGTLYKYYQFSPQTTVLLRGSAEQGGQRVEMPVAWTHRYGKARIFYTSLGHQQEFDSPTFTRLLTNAVYWCLRMSVPGARAAASGRRAARTPASR